MLFGLLFFVPLLGMAIGAAMGGLTAAWPMSGSTTTSSNRPATRSPLGTSALFLLSTDAVVDRVMDALRGTGIELIATNLSSEQEDKLRTAFEHE